MKFPDKEYEVLKQAIGLQLSRQPGLRKWYRDKHLTNMRFRWDLMWIVVDAGDFDLNVLYRDPHNLNDEQVDTVLRRIVNEYYEGGGV